MTGDRPPGRELEAREGLGPSALRPVAPAHGSRALSTGVALVACALVLALVKPWSLLGSGGAPGLPPGTPRTTGNAGGASPSILRPSHAADAGAACSGPPSWRTATIERWGDRQARVWNAAEVSPGGILDPATPFEPIITEQVLAIGWCAPVTGPERPPLAARGRLLLLGPLGPEPVPYRRIEPEEPNALGELWAPVGTWNRSGTPASLTWPPGRYLIVLSTGRGWERLIGIEIFDGRRDPSPSSAPGGSGSPGVTPGQSPGAGGG